MFIAKGIDVITRRNTRKRKELLEAAESIFFSRGYRKVTVEDICREAGASRMTFYKYFPNKIELFKTVWDQLIDQAYDHLYEVDKTDLPFSEKMRLVLTHKMEMLSRMSPELIEELLHNDPDIGGYLLTAQKRSMEQFLAFLQKAQDRGDMRKIRPEFILAFIGKMRELIEDEELIKVYPDKLSFIEELNAFFFFGIIPPDRKVR